MSSHDPVAQSDSLDKKLVAALQKFAEVFKYLLLQKGKQFGLSPIQVQILLFIAYHPQPEYRTVSYLADELNLTRPTVSDAVKLLHSKGYILKQMNEDGRSYSICLSESGRKLLPELDNFDQRVMQSVVKIDEQEKPELLKNLLAVLSDLESHGVINEQRMCFKCAHLSVRDGVRFCNLLNKSLENKYLRVDCPEFLNKDKT